MGLFITSIWAAFIDRLSVNQRLPIRWLLNGRKQEKQTFKVSKFEKINYWYCFLLNSVIHWKQLLPWAKRSSQNIWILINCKSSPSYLLQQLRNDKYFLQEIISQNVYTIVVNPHFGTLYILKLGMKWRSVYSWQDSFLICQDWKEQFWFSLASQFSSHDGSLQICNVHFSWCWWRRIPLNHERASHPLSETDGSPAIFC